MKGETETRDGRKQNVSLFAERQALEPLFFLITWLISYITQYRDIGHSLTLSYVIIVVIH